MPHDAKIALIKRDLVGKDGAERVKVLRAHLADMPSFRSGPYADLRRRLIAEIDRIETQAHHRHQEFVAVTREGHRQVAVLGAPNAGKSALLRSLTGMQIKVADYAFATLTPTPCLVTINDAQLQLVEIPGLMPDAGAGRLSIQALLGTARTADRHLYIASLRDDPAALAFVVDSVRATGVERPSAFCITGADLYAADDDTARGRLAELRRMLPDLPTVVCSTETGEGVDQVRAMLWELGGLMRVSPKDSAADAKPFILDRGATALDFADAIHHDLAKRFVSARVWGASARFPGQTVGPGHVLQDEDIVDIKFRK
jgi:small GTP-binding protein